VKTNYKILIRLLGLGGIILLVISRVVRQEPVTTILRFVGLALVAALVIQIMVFNMKPGLYKDKPGRPD
jgi:uncharacterized membrane protein